MRRATAALACAAGAFVFPAAAQDTGLSATGGCASVPLLRGAVPVVEVKIGTKGPYRFAIDTGAPGHGMISPALAAQLGLPRIRTQGAEPVFGAPEVSVGGVSFKNPDLAAMPAGGEWDGVLGTELMKLLPVTLDYGSGRMRLGGPGLEEGIRMRFEGGVPMLPIDIAGKRFEVRFDSGSAAALDLDETTARSLPLAGEPVSSGGALEAPLAVPVTLGAARLSVAAVAWPSTRGGGSLGSRALAGMAITIDPDSQLARVETSGAPPRCDAPPPREPLPPERNASPFDFRIGVGKVPD